MNRGDSNKYSKQYQANTQYDTSNKPDFDIEINEADPDIDNCYNTNNFIPSPTKIHQFVITRLNRKIRRCDYSIVMAPGNFIGIVLMKECQQLITKQTIDKLVRSRIIIQSSFVENEKITLWLPKVSQFMYVPTVHKSLWMNSIEPSMSRLEAACKAVLNVINSKQRSKSYKGVRKQSHKVKKSIRKDGKRQMNLFESMNRKNKKTSVVRTVGDKAVPHILKTPSDRGQIRGYLDGIPDSVVQDINNPMEFPPIKNIFTGEFSPPKNKMNYEGDDYKPSQEVTEFFEMGSGLSGPRIEEIEKQLEEITSQPSNKSNTSTNDIQNFRPEDYIRSYPCNKEEEVKPSDSIKTDKVEPLTQLTNESSKDRSPQFKTSKSNSLDTKKKRGITKNKTNCSKRKRKPRRSKAYKIPEGCSMVNIKRDDIYSFVWLQTLSYCNPNIEGLDEKLKKMGNSMKSIIQLNEYTSNHMAPNSAYYKNAVSMNNILTKLMKNIQGYLERAAGEIIGKGIYKEGAKSKELLEVIVQNAKIRKHNRNGVASDVQSDSPTPPSGKIYKYATRIPSLSSLKNFIMLVGNYVVTLLTSQAAIAFKIMKVRISDKVFNFSNIYKLNKK